MGDFKTLDSRKGQGGGLLKTEIFLAAYFGHGPAVPSVEARGRLVRVDVAIPRVTIA